MQTVREYFLECFKSERPKFVRVLQAVPADRASYRPHELIDHGKATFMPKPAPAVTDSVKAYERNAAEFEKRLPKIDDAQWSRKAQFLVNGNVAWEAPLGDMLFGFLLDAIHHRGQLSTYLRPMGAKVPSIYGPSGDDPGM
jgi:hypothetical protein